jgi:hypothetical protein
MRRVKLGKVVSWATLSQPRPLRCLRNPLTPLARQNEKRPARARTARSDHVVGDDRHDLPDGLTSSAVSSSARSRSDLPRAVHTHSDRGLAVRTGALVPDALRGPAAVTTRRSVGRRSFGTDDRWRIARGRRILPRALGTNVLERTTVRGVAAVERRARTCRADGGRAFRTSALRAAEQVPGARLLIALRVERLRAAAGIDEGAAIAPVPSLRTGAAFGRQLRGTRKARWVRTITASAGTVATDRAHATGSTRTHAARARSSVPRAAGSRIRVGRSSASSAGCGRNCKSDDEGRTTGTLHAPRISKAHAGKMCATWLRARRPWRRPFRPSSPGVLPRSCA